MEFVFVEKKWKELDESLGRENEAIRPEAEKN